MVPLAGIADSGPKHLTLCADPWVEMVPDGSDAWAATWYKEAWHCIPRDYSCFREGETGDGYGCKGGKVQGWSLVSSAGDLGTDTITRAEYQHAVLVLFEEFLQMKEDGVFLDQATIDLFGPDYEFSSTIRGDNPPGGWFGRPPGSDWLERVQSLDDTGHKFVCFDIPAMPSEIGICGHDLMSLHAAQAFNDISFLDSVAARFWLATICHKTPEACAPYVDE